MPVQSYLGQIKAGGAHPWAGMWEMAAPELFAPLQEEREGGQALLHKYTKLLHTK